MRPLVVLPTYNERENIGCMLAAVRASLPEAHVLVVDDSSPDGTAALAEQAASRLEQIHVLVRAAKEGLGPAYLAGFAWGLEHGFDVMVEMDSDFQHDPVALPTLVGPLEDGYEVVIGSRYVPGGEIPEWAFLRRFISRGGNEWAAFALHLGVNDSTGGFRAYSADLLRRIDLGSVRARGYGFQIEMTYRAELAGARVMEVPIRFSDRSAGTSKMSLHTVVEAFGLVTWWGLARRLGRDAVPRARHV